MTAQQYANPQYLQGAYVPVGAIAMPAYGSFFRRLGALTIDLVVVFFAFFLSGIMIGIAGGSDAAETLASLDEFGSGGTVVVNAALTAALVGFNALGGTPGKRMLGLRITNREGGLPGISLAIVRAWPWIALTLTNVAMYVAVQSSDSADVSSSLLERVTYLAQGIWLIGCFLALGTKYKQSLHDKLAGTYVIRS